MSILSPIEITIQRASISSIGNRFNKHIWQHMNTRYWSVQLIKSKQFSARGIIFWNQPVYCLFLIVKPLNFRFCMSVIVNKHILKNIMYYLKEMLHFQLATHWIRSNRAMPLLITAHIGNAFIASHQFWKSTLKHLHLQCTLAKRFLFSNHY